MLVPIFAKTIRHVLPLALALAAPPAAALFGCEKEDGGVRYVSDPEECGRPSRVPSYEPLQAPAAAPVLKLPPAPESAINLKPKISPQQTARDRKRGKILLHELRGEVLRRDYWTEKINAADRESLRKKFKEQQRLHALNIVAIVQELARLGIHVGDTGN